MKLRDCRERAKDWVERMETGLPGYVGAYLGGSAAALTDDAEISGGSDLDVYVVLDGAIPPKRGKFAYCGALLEISYISKDAIFPAEKALGDYHLANSLRHRAVIADTDGALADLTAQVAAGFDRRETVLRRRDYAISKAQSGLENLRMDAPLPDRAIGFLFPTGILTHAVLVSALRNPTVRLRYLRCGELLAERGMGEAHEELLRLAGFANVTQETAEALLRDTERAFERAGRFMKTEFPFSSDLAEVSRPAAIDALRRLIMQGRHRETLFWVLTTFARSMKQLLADAPAEYEALLPDFHRALAAVGRGTEGEILAARDAALAYIPTLNRLTERIMDETPEILR